jgi:hypothetical protein
MLTVVAAAPVGHDAEGTVATLVPSGHYGAPVLVLGANVVVVSVVVVIGANVVVAVSVVVVLEVLVTVYVTVTVSVVPGPVTV